MIFYHSVPRCNSTDESESVLTANVPNVLDHLPQILDILCEAPSGLILDFDGTISPIAPTPSEAKVDPCCRKALKALVHRLSLVALLSGRPAGEVREMVGVPGISYLGNHGLDRWQDGRTMTLPKVEAYRHSIAQALIDARAKIRLPGVIFEDKGIVLAVHYRLHPKPHVAGQAILPLARSIAAAYGLTVAEGKSVVELRPAVGINKGTAIADLIDERHLKAALYLGDDSTDLAAFRRLRKLRQTGRCNGIAVAVLAADTPKALLRAADYAAAGVPAIASALHWLGSQTISQTS